MDDYLGKHAVRQAEGRFSGARGLSIYYQYWTPETAPRALLLVVHGAGEHSARYQQLARYFTGRGFAVAALDHPGHGKSGGRYGHVDRFEDFVATLEIFQRRVAAAFPGLPQILVGHSMGGLISSLYLLQHQQDFAGCVLSGPAVKTDIEPGYLQLLLIRCLSVVAPGAGVLQLDAGGVSRDPAVVANYVNDPLVNHGKMSARMVAELFKCMHRIQAEAGAITLPMLLLHGGGDVMAAPEGSRFLYDHISSVDKTLEIYPGLYHEIFNEPEREAIYAGMLDWCDRRLPGIPAD
jgi:alpha-beta hydrolase superfamily lysophospholipase